MKFKAIILSLLFGCSFISMYATDDFYTFTVTSVTKDGTTIGHNQRPELSERAALAEGTVINIRYDENVVWNASQIRAIEYAARLWEEKMPTLYPRLNLRVGFISLPENELCRTGVTYYFDKIACIDGAGKYTTGATVKFWTGNDTFFTHNLGENLLPYMETDDIYILLNNNEELFYWGTDGNTPSDKYDAVTVVMREIMRGLGMNISLRQVGNQYVLDQFVMPQNSLVNFSLYDYVVLYKDRGASGDWDTQIQSVATSPTGSAMINNFNFYVPSVFEYGKSYNYLVEDWAIDNGLALLKPSLNKGESIHFVGNLIEQFFESIFKWSVPLWTSTGSTTPLVSASDTIIEYEEGYCFTYDPSENSLQIPDSLMQQVSTAIVYGYDGEDCKNFDGYNGNNEWRLDMLKADGRFVTVKQLDGGLAPFDVYPSDIPDTVRWARNADGCLRGRIYHKSIFDQPYSFCHVFLDFVPEVPRVDIVEKASPMRTDIPYLYLAHNAEGAERVRIRHESDYGVYYYDYSPNQEYIDFSDADPWVENIFTIYAVNENATVQGNTVQWGGEEFMRDRQRNRSELVVSQSSDNTSLTLKAARTTDVKIEQYILARIDNGCVVCSGASDDETVIIDNTLLTSGVYVARVFDAYGNAYSAKIIVK